MLFSDDILFRNGSLALVWLAGNEELRKKGRRNRQFQAVLQAKVGGICRDMRKLIPAMGSANGLSLKKMGALVRGLGVIYAFKVDNFARDVYAATVVLKRPVTLVDPKLDVAQAPRAKAKTVTEKSVGPAAVSNQYGEIPFTLDADIQQEQEFGQVEGFAMGVGDENVFGTPRAVPGRFSSVGSPIQPIRLYASPTRSVDMEGERRQERVRSTRKRRLEDDEETIYNEVRQRLKRNILANERAHLLPEDNGILPPPQAEEFQGDLDFGGEQAIFDILRDNGRDLAMNDMQMPFPEGEGSVFDSRAVPPPATTLDDIHMGPPSTVLDSRTRGLETPQGAGIVAENQKRRRGDGEREPDTTVMELEEVQEVERRRRRAKRRRLIVDLEIMIPPRKRLHRAVAARTECSMDELHELLVETRATGKSKWKMLSRGFECIASAGRGFPSTGLREMAEDIMKAQRRRPVAVFREVSMEQEREDAEDQSRGIGISAGMSAFEGGRSVSAGGVPELELEPVLIERQEVSPPRELPPELPDRSEVGENLGQEAFEDHTVFPQAPDFDPPQFETSDVLPRRRRREERVNEQANLQEQIDRTDAFQSFRDLCSPSEFSRKRAAVRFFALLKMQATKEVLLHQEEPYGPIRIERLR